MQSLRTVTLTNVRRQRGKRKSEKKEKEVKQIQRGKKCQSEKLVAVVSLILDVPKAQPRFRSWLPEIVSVVNFLFFKLN